MTLTTLLLILGAAAVGATLSAAVFSRRAEPAAAVIPDQATLAAPACLATPDPDDSALDEDTMDPRAVTAAALPPEDEDEDDEATVLYADIDWEQLAEDLF